MKGEFVKRLTILHYGFMREEILHHLLYRVANAPLQTYPYPHFHATEVFPKEYYEEILSALPPKEYFQNMSQTGKVDPRTYQARFLLSLEESSLSQIPLPYLFFWKPFADSLQSPLWISTLVNKFRDSLPNPMQPLSSVAELIKDTSRYSIGPHTDHPIRALTLLFYFPSNTDHMKLGTSLYRPRNDNFSCEGLIHHPFDGFIKVHTAPFLPNSIFGFVKSKTSFHGVEPIQELDIERNLLNYYLKWSSTSTST